MAASIQLYLIQLRLRLAQALGVVFYFGVYPPLFHRFTVFNGVTIGDADVATEQPQHLAGGGCVFKVLCTKLFIFKKHNPKIFRASVRGNGGRPGVGSNNSMVINK